MKWTAAIAIALLTLTASVVAQGPAASDPTYRHVRSDNQRPWDITFHANKTLDIIYYGPNGVEIDTGTWWDGPDGRRYWRYTRWQAGKIASAVLSDFERTLIFQPG
jgi:hypothetical protein